MSIRRTDEERAHERLRQVEDDWELKLKQLRTQASEALSEQQLKHEEKLRKGQEEARTEQEQ